MDRSYFETLFHSHSPIYHSLYSDVPSLVSMITAVDLADFILVSHDINLRYLNLIPILSFGGFLFIRYLSYVYHSIPLYLFLTFVTYFLLKDQIIFLKKYLTAGIYHSAHIYFLIIIIIRYRTKHSVNTKIGLELSCYGNGVSQSIDRQINKLFKSDYIINVFSVVNSMANSFL